MHEKNSRINFILFATILNIPVNPVLTNRVVPARIAVALVDVNLAIRSRRTSFAKTLISVNQILTYSSELARIGLALVDLMLA